MESILKKANASTQKPGLFSTLHWTILIVSLPFGILDFMLPIYGKGIGASAVEIGLLFSSFSLMSVLLRPLVGAGVDRFGRRWFFIGGLAAYATAMLGFAFSTQIWGLVIARVLEGIAASLLWLSANAIVADMAGATQRGGSFGSVSQSTSIGGIVGVFIGFTVLFQFGMEQGWNPLFLFFTAASLISTLVAWRRMPETLPRTRSHDTRRSSGVLALLRSRSILLLLLVSLVTGAAAAMLAPILMIFLQEKLNAGVAELAWAFLPSGIAWSVLPSRLGRLSDRFGRKPLMLLGMGAAAVTSFAIPQFNSLVALAILWLMQSICHAASGPAGQALVADLTGEAERGRAFGLFALAGGLGATIGPLAGGWLYDAVGQAAPFYGNAIALAVCAVLLGLFLREKPLASR